MPRQTSTRERVYQVADTLLAEGVKPTQQLVRERIGSGSITTINQALNSWWQSLGERMSRRQQHPELPEPVVSAAGALWDQAMAYAADNLSVERQQLREQVAKAVATERELREQLREDYSALQQQHSELIEQQRELNTQRAEHAQQVRELEERLIAQQREMDELKLSQRQMEHLQRQGVNVSADNSDALLEAQVANRVAAHRIEQLEAALAAEQQRSSSLSQALEQEQTDRVQQCHRLELVIAQQDAKYQEAQRELERCRAG